MIGDLIEYQYEQGVLCHQDPYIMKTIHFNSYVPITESFKTITKKYEDSVYIKPEIVQRITDYLKLNDLFAIATGD